MRARLPVCLALPAATCMLAQPVGAAPRAPLPELSLSEVTHTRHAFVGPSAERIRFCALTHNRGTGGTGRRLHNVMALVGQDVSKVVARRDVPRLPGTEEARRGRNFSHRGRGRGRAIPLDLPPGAHEVQICAEQALRQRNVRKNCHVRDKALVVIEREWTGTTGGEAPVVTSPSANETWQAARVSWPHCHRRSRAAGRRRPDPAELDRGSARHRRARRHRGGAVVLTATGDAAAICDPAAVTPPAERPWSAPLRRRGEMPAPRRDALPRRRPGARRPLYKARPGEVRIRFVVAVRGIRWTRFGGRTAVGVGRFTSLVPCAGGCSDNGMRLQVRLSRPGYCRGDARPGRTEDAVFYTKIAFVVVKQLGVRKPGTEWISTIRRDCSSAPRPTRIP